MLTPKQKYAMTQVCTFAMYEKMSSIRCSDLQVIYIFLEPIIVEFPTDTHAIEGKGVVFNVVVRGNPQPSLTWYHHNTQLTPDYSLDLLQDGSLSITSSELRHSGVYKVLVENSKGSVEREVKLTVTSEEVKESSADNPRVVINPIPVAEFGNYVSRNHSHSNEQFIFQYTVC